MARRVPYTDGTKAVERLYEYAPWAPWGEMGGIGATCDGDAIKMASDYERRKNQSDRRTSVQKYLSGDFGIVGKEVLVLGERWTGCRQVLRFNETAYGEIAGQKLQGDLPVEALAKLPYPIQYIEVPGGIAVPSALAVTGHEDRRGGFFVYQEPGHLFIAYPPGANDVSNGFVGLTIKLQEGRKFEDCVDETVQHVEAQWKIDLQHVRAECLGRGMDEQVEAVIQEYSKRHSELFDTNRVRDLLREAMNLVLYVNSENADMEVVHRPPSGKRGERLGTRAVTVTMVGARVGQALGEAGVRYDRDRDVAEPLTRPGGDRAEAKPHMRRAHWHWYWVGKRKGRTDGRYGDDIVLRWVPPVLVNAGRGGAAEEVVHPVGPGHDVGAAEVLSEAKRAAKAQSVTGRIGDSRKRVSKRRHK